MAIKTKQMTTASSEPFAAETLSGFKAVKTLEAPKAEPSMKTRMTIQGIGVGVQFSAMMLANKDANNEGWDDYFAFKLNQLSAEMQQFAATGKLPTDGE